MLVNDPQIWTLIGVFAAIVIGGMSITTTLLSRNITTAIGGLRGELHAEMSGLAAEMNARFDAVGHRFDATDTRIDALHTEMNVRFDAVNTRIDHLDRDVDALARRVWGEAPDH